MTKIEKHHSYVIILALSEYVDFLFILNGRSVRSLSFSSTTTILPRPPSPRTSLRRQCLGQNVAILPRPPSPRPCLGQQCSGADVTPAGACRKSPHLARVDSGFDAA